MGGGGGGVGADFFPNKLGELSACGFFPKKLGELLASSFFLKYLCLTAKMGSKPESIISEIRVLVLFKECISE